MDMSEYQRQEGAIDLFTASCSNFREFYNEAKKHDKGTRYNLHNEALKHADDARAFYRKAMCIEGLLKHFKILLEREKSSIDEKVAEIEAERKPKRESVGVLVTT